MRMTVKFKNGVTDDALLLGVGRDRIRVVVAGRHTTEEWLMLDGRLFDEDGRIIEVLALLALDGIDYSQLLGLFARTTAAAGFGGSVA